MGDILCVSPVCSIFVVVKKEHPNQAYNYGN